MKYDFSTILLDLKGKSIKMRTDPKDETVVKDMTLADAAVEALMNLNGNEHVSGIDRNKRGMMAQRLCNGGEVDLQLDDAKLVLDLIGKAFPPGIVMRAYEVLDPPPTPS